MPFFPFFSVFVSVFFSLIKRISQQLGRTGIKFQKYGQPLNTQKHTTQLPQLARFLQDFQEFQDSKQELQETLRPCSSSSRFQRQTSLTTKSVLGSYANNLDKQLNTWTDLTTKGKP